MMAATPQHRPKARIRPPKMAGKYRAAAFISSFRFMPRMEPVIRAAMYQSRKAPSPLKNLVIPPTRSSLPKGRVML